MFEPDKLKDKSLFIQAYETYLFILGEIIKRRIELTQSEKELMECMAPVKRMFKKMERRLWEKDKKGGYVVNSHEWVQELVSEVEALWQTSQ